MFQALILSVIGALFLLESRVSASESIPPYVQGYRTDTARSRCEFLEREEMRSLILITKKGCRSLAMVRAKSMSQPLSDRKHSGDVASTLIPTAIL